MLEDPAIGTLSIRMAFVRPSHALVRAWGAEQSEVSPTPNWCLRGELPGPETPSLGMASHAFVGLNEPGDWGTFGLASP